MKQVGTVLLSCAFLYDIFWVFVSKKLFHESVMIVVSTAFFTHMLDHGYCGSNNVQTFKY